LLLVLKVVQKYTISRNKKAVQFSFYAWSRD